MNMVPELIDKYIWLIRTLTDAGGQGLSLAELSYRWEDRYGGPYPRRTFNNHREAIAEIFGIEIECRRSTSRYFIRAGKDATDSDASINWLVNTFTVNSLLMLKKERLSGRVSVEDIPSGQKFLTTVMSAMKDDEELDIVYGKYTAGESERVTVRPYAVKEFGKRWYLVGHCNERGGMRTYGLDRIVSAAPNGRKFKMPEGFDVDELFSRSFGIYLPENDSASIVKIKTTELEAKYIRDLPLHPSQEEYGNCLFRYYVIPDTAFIMELCKHGARIEVLEPEEVRNQVAEELFRAADIYRKPHGDNEKNDIR